MKDKEWLEVSRAANRCYWKINPKTESMNVLLDIYNGCLPKLLNDIAIKAFIYGHDTFGPDLNVVRNGMIQLEDKGFIGEENKND